MSSKALKSIPRSPVGGGRRLPRPSAKALGSSGKAPSDDPRRQLGLLEAFFEHSLDCLVLLDPQFNFLRVNEVYARACGRGVEEFFGHNHFEFYPHPENEAIFREVVKSRKPYQVSAKAFRFPDHPEWGVTYWDWTLVPVCGDRGEVEFLVLSLRDVTLRKRMETALLENEARYRSLVTATAQVVWITSPEGQIVEELPTWQGFTGQSRQEYQGAGWLEAVHPDDRPAVMATWSKAVATRALYVTEYRLRRADGEYRYVGVRGVPVLDDHRDIREWIGICVDITERKEAERRREFTNALLGLFVQKVTLKEYLEGVLQVLQQWSGCDALGIRLAHEHALPYVVSAGFEPEFLELEKCLSADHDPCCCARALNQSFVVSDQPFLTRGGSFRSDDIQTFLPRLTEEHQAKYRGHCARFGFASLAVIPLRYHDTVLGVIHMADRRRGQFPAPKVEFIESMTPLIGEAVHRFQAEAELVTYREKLEEKVQQRTMELEAANRLLQLEIAERRRAQESLQQTAQELERSNSDLEQFAYVASHDLQEPLRAVGGYVRLLQLRFPDGLDPKALEYIAGAADGAARMERLINDLLTFSRLGTQPPMLAEADLNLLFRDAVRNLQASIRAAQAIVTCEPLPTLRVDATQMVQLFQNLLGNAVKFRSERPPRIHVAGRAESDRWVISVRDNGIGIEAKYYERIFQIFQRLHTRRHYAGTGIGLAICKKIVERHAGSIWVESQPGQGSSFFFSIPQPSNV
jgi:PAS domain S-box-containing protein